MSFELIFFSIFIPFFIFVCFTFYKDSGWKSLSEKYKTNAYFEGNIVKNITAFFKDNVHCSGVLNLGINDQHLYFSMNPFFKLFTPSLLVPIEDVSFSIEKKNILYKFKIEFNKYPDVFVFITKRNARKLGIEI